MAKATTKPVKKPAKKPAKPKPAEAPAESAPTEQETVTPIKKEADHNGGNTLTDGERRGICFHHFDKIKVLVAEIEEMKADLAELYKTAKDDGVTKKDIQFMLKCADFDKKFDEAARVKREAEIASWFALPIHYQKDLFDLDRVEPLNERAKREGYAAGYEGKDPNPPYGIDSEAGQIWMTEWHAAQADRRAEFASGMEKRLAQRRMSAEPDDEPFDDEDDSGARDEEGAPAGASLQ